MEVEGGRGGRKLEFANGLFRKGAERRKDVKRKEKENKNKKELYCDCNTTNK